jgi:predicted DNA-binding transcriptional regulator AlpA
MPKHCPTDQSPEIRKAAHTPVNFDNLPDTGFVRQPQVLEVVPFSPASLWRKCKAGTFPRPRKLSDRVTAWQVGEVRAWLESHTAA